MATNITFIFIGIFVLLIFFIIFSIIHIRSLRDELNFKWYNLNDLLQYRQDLIPNLIETVRLFVPKSKLDEDLIKKIIEIRARAGKNVKPGAAKIVIEHDLSRHIEKLFKLGIIYKELGTSTNFLELKKEFKDLREKIEKSSNEYNEAVRRHNIILRKIYNKIPALIMRYKEKFIFEFE
jgi:LemA protein